MPGRVEPRTRAVLLLVAPLLDLAFGTTLEGWERLPPGRPALVVANHSGGGAMEVLCLATVLLRRKEPVVLTGLAHPVAFWIPVVAWFLRGLGAVPSSYGAAARALASGCSVLVFPGGDHEGFRPIWQARRVDFAGRQGFLRVARQAWVPIVPLAIRGSHYTNPILWRSRVLPWLAILPRLLGLKRLPVTIPWLLGIVAILAFVLPGYGAGAAVLGCLLWSIFPLPYFLPIVPWRIRVVVGDPIEPEALFGKREDESPLEPAYAVVTGKVQGLLTGPSPTS